MGKFIYFGPLLSPDFFNYVAGISYLNHHRFVNHSPVKGTRGRACQQNGKLYF